MSKDKEEQRNKIKVIQFDKDKNRLVESDQPNETFEDVGGLEEVKKKIRTQFIMPLKNPEFYKAYGKSAGGSLLLYGPPGCGKTFMARAVAGEIDANFIHLDLQSILSMWVGESEHNLHNIFETAREQKPCVLFIDELDAIGGNRQNLRQHHERILVNQLLLELDGLESYNQEVYVIGATNTPWYLDPALRRPGRFNTLIFMPPPDENERKIILELKAKDKPQEKLDFKKIAVKTENFSGADLDHLIQDSIDMAIEESMETGELKPLTDSYLKKALSKRKPTTLEWFSTAKNYATFSDVNQDYQGILEYMKKNRIR
ncbi:26S protease regulatory subunit [Alkalihalobacillus sp. AL-G]|uniref:ATP-binding protein n=1 Tax=Alkalihalobacillus sp. AL-G TaxID=2926399 RepID=UPI00272C6DA9|nr:ATP-binding protein [Alkalihalobacillus sp. AL-G]WLD92547.1 ATP-binding protein [Alkalihalobacillus sp. AL-G]